MVSAFLAHPDWPRAATRCSIPHGTFNGAYMLAVVGTVGTTITPWGQGFIQAYVVDKRLRPEELRAERIDVLIGVLITNVIARVHRHRVRGDAVGDRQRDIKDAGEAAAALGPLAGNVASTMFAVGLLAASLLAWASFRWRGLHGVRGVRLGAGRGLALARGAGVLRPARVLHRLSPPCSC